MRHLVAALLLGATASAGAQAPATVRIPPSYKDGTLATVLSFMGPGMGQFYVGRGGKGVLIFSSVLGGIAYSSQSKCTNRSAVSGTCFEYKKNSGAGYVVAGVAYFWGLLSAASDVEEHNIRILRREQARAAEGPEIDSESSFMAPAAVRRRR